MKKTKKIEKSNEKDKVAIQGFDTVSFLSEIEAQETISKKVAIMNRVLSQESEHVKNLREEYKKNTGKDGGKGMDYDYISIGIVEEALRQVFFRQVDFNIMTSYRDLNSFIVVARISYKDPITLEMRSVDGIGAKALQQDYGSKITEFNSTMKYNALELGVASAYSRAIKNGAKKIGKLFGADLNRDDELDSVSVFKSKVVMSDAEKVSNIEELIKELNIKGVTIPKGHGDNIDTILNEYRSTSFDAVIKYLNSLKAIK